MVLIFSSIAAVVTAASLLLELKFWPEMKTKEKRTKKKQQQQNINKATNKNKQKQISQKNSIKYYNIQVVQIF